MTDPTHLGTFLFFTVISKVSITTVLNIHIIRNVQGQSIINMLQRKTVMWRVPEIISFVLNTWHLKVSGLKKKSQNSTKSYKMLVQKTCFLTQHSISSPEANSCILLEVSCKPKQRELLESSFKTQIGALYIHCILS